ncbi:unnamed protein product, partial [Rotaria sp. Silwood1]
MDILIVKNISSNKAEPNYVHDGGIIAAIFLALISFIFTCLVNGLASTGPNKFFNKSTAKLAFLVYSIVNIWRKTDDGFLYIHPYTLHVAIFILFIANILLNSFWLVLWDRLKFGFSTIILYLMVATIVGACVLDHIFLWQTRWDFIRLNKSGDIWMMRFIVLNGHAVYSAWLLVASSLNLTIWLKNKLPLNVEGWATTISLILLTIGIIVYWIFENFIFPSPMAYTWSPWLIQVKHNNNSINTINNNDFEL